MEFEQKNNLLVEWDSPEAGQRKDKTQIPGGFEMNYNQNKKLLKLLLTP
jgi:hypothetical protein